MSKLPKGWEERPAGTVRYAIELATKVEVYKEPGKPSAIWVAHSLMLPSEAEALAPRLREAAAIARQWDEEMGAK